MHNSPVPIIYVQYVLYSCWLAALVLASPQGVGQGICQLLERGLLRCKRVQLTLHSGDVLALLVQGPLQARHSGQQIINNLLLGH